MEIDCGYCGELFGTDDGTQNTKNKPKILNCQHILCSNCLGAQIRTLPEENLVMIICPFCAEPTVKEIPADVSESLQDISRCSSYDSDVSTSNIDTTPIDFQHSRSRIDYDEDRSFDRSNIHPLLASDFDELNQSTNLDMPTYEGIYKINEHINDSTELDQDHTPPSDEENYPQIEHSSYVDPVQVEISELESFAHWTLIAMDLSILLFVILDLLGGLDELAKRGLFYMHASVSLQNMGYALLLLHLFLQELPNSSLSQSYQLIRAASFTEQNNDSFERERQHVNAHVAALLVVLDLSAVLALFLSANRASVTIIWHIIQLEAQNTVTTGTVSVFGAAIITSIIVVSILLATVLFVQTAVEQENTISAARSKPSIHTSPFTKSPMDPNTTEIDEHTRRILRRHNLSNSRSPSATLQDLRINISTVYTANEDAFAQIDTVRSGVYSPRLYVVPTHSSSSSNRSSSMRTSSVYTSSVDANSSDTNDSDSGNVSLSIPRIDSSDSIRVTQSRDDDWLLDKQEDQGVEVECNFDDIYAHSEDEADLQEHKEEETEVLLARMHDSHTAGIVNAPSSVQSVPNVDTIPDNLEEAQDARNETDHRKFELYDVYPVMPDLDSGESEDTQSNTATVVVNCEENIPQDVSVDVIPDSDVCVVGESCVYSPLQPLRIADLSLSPLSSPSYIPLSFVEPVQSEEVDSNITEDTNNHTLLSVPSEPEPVMVEVKVEVPQIPGPLSTAVLLPPLSPEPSPLLAPVPAPHSPSTYPVTALPLSLSTQPSQPLLPLLPLLPSQPSLPLNAPAGASKVRSRRKKGHKPWHKKHPPPSIPSVDTITEESITSSIEEAANTMTSTLPSSDNAVKDTVTSSAVPKKVKYPLSSPQTVRAVRKSILESGTSSNSNSTHSITYSATNSASDNSLPIPSDAVSINPANTDELVPEAQRTPSRKTGRTTPEPEGLKKLKVRTPEPLSYSELFEQQVASSDGPHSYGKTSGVEEDGTSTSIVVSVEENAGVEEAGPIDESIIESAVVPLDEVAVTTDHATSLCITTTLPSYDAYSDSEGSCDTNSTFNSTNDLLNVRTVRVPHRRILQTQQVYPEPVDMSNASLNVSINTLAYGSSHYAHTKQNAIGVTDNLCNTTDASMSLYKDNSCADYTIMDELVSPTVVAMYKTSDNTVSNNVAVDQSLQTDLFTHIDSTTSPTAATKVSRAGARHTEEYVPTTDSPYTTSDTTGTQCDTTNDASNSNNTAEAESESNLNNINADPTVTPELAPLIPSPRRTVAFNAIAQAYIDKISGTSSRGSGGTNTTEDVDIIESEGDKLVSTNDATTPTDTVHLTTTTTTVHPVQSVVDSDTVSVVSSTSAVSSRHPHTRAYSLGTTLLLNAADDIESMFETLANDVEAINQTMHDIEENSMVKDSNDHSMVLDGADVNITLPKEQTSNSAALDGEEENEEGKDTSNKNDGDDLLPEGNVEGTSEKSLAYDFIYPDLSSPKPDILTKPHTNHMHANNNTKDTAPLSPFSVPTTPHSKHTSLHNNTTTNATSPEMSGLDLSRIYPVQEECMYDRNDIPDPVNDVFETYSDARLSSASSEAPKAVPVSSKDIVVDGKPSGSGANPYPLQNPLVTKRSAANVVYSPYNYTAELPATALPTLSPTHPIVTTTGAGPTTPVTAFTPITANHSANHSASMYTMNSTNSNSVPRSRSNIRASIRERMDIRLGKTPQPRISATTSTDDPTISVTTPTLNTTADVDRFEHEMNVFNMYATTNASTYSGGMNSGSSLGRNALSRTHSMENNNSGGLSPTYSSISSANRKEMVTTATSPMKPYPKRAEESMPHAVDVAELGDYMPSKTLNPSLLRYHQQQQQYQQHQHVSQVDLLSRNANSIEHSSHTSVAMAIVAEMREEVSTSPPVKLNADVEHHSTHNTHTTHHTHSTHNSMHSHTTPLLRPTHSMYSEAGSSVTDSNASSTASSMYDMSSVRNVTSPYNFDATPVRAPTPVYTTDNPNVLSTNSVTVSSGVNSTKSTPPGGTNATTPNSHHSSGILKNMANMSFFTHYSSTNTTSVASNSNMVRPSPLLRPVHNQSTNHHTLPNHATKPVGSPALRKHASMNNNNITAALSASKNAINLRSKGINNPTTTTTTTSSAVNTPYTASSERSMAHSASNYSLASNKSKGTSSLDCVSDAMDSSSSYVVVLHMNQALTTHRCIGKIAKCITAVVVKCQERNCPVVVLVSLPNNNNGSGGNSGSVNTVYSYLYAVPNSRATAYDLHSTDTIEYIVKVRSKPCWLIPPSDNTNSPTKLNTVNTNTSINLTERMFRSTLSALVNLDANRSSTNMTNNMYGGMYGKHSGGGVNSPNSPDVDPRVLYENHLNGLRNEIKTALGAFTSTSDVVVVCDGTCWPFQSPPHIANQSAALSAWLLYRTSVPYLQFHFVAISTVSAGGSISGAKSVESK